MTTKLKATVKPVKKTIQVRESLVPKMKELYPNIVIADNDFKYDDVQSVKHAEFYFEDPVDYTEIKKTNWICKIWIPYSNCAFS